MEHALLETALLALISESWSSGLEKAANENRCPVHPGGLPSLSLLPDIGRVPREAVERHAGRPA